MSTVVMLVSCEKLIKVYTRRDRERLKRRGEKESNGWYACNQQGVVKRGKGTDTKRNERCDGSVECWLKGQCVKKWGERLSER